MKQKLRRIIAAFAKRATKEDKGKTGERFAREWFEDQGFEFYEIPQTPDTMPTSLSLCGGKRPDFMVTITPGESVVYIDAKFHETNGVTEFALAEEELRKFEAFRLWAHKELKDDGDRDIILMLYPQELNGDRFVWIHLDEILAGQSTVIDGKPAKKVSLLDREGLWIESP